MAKKRSARRRAAPLAAAVEPRPIGALLQVCLTVALLAVYTGFLAHPVDLTTADLGRYLKNGELFFHSGFIADTNLFAYTTPDHPFVNHSWGSGAIYFLVERTLGFAGLSLFFLAVSVATLWIFFRLAVRHGSFALGAVGTVVVMPILITRYEIRPEMFSYLLSGLFLTLLWDYRQGYRGARWLMILPLLQLVWVNLHIYFFIGMFLVGVFLLQSLIDLAAQSSPRASSPGQPWKVLTAVAAATFAASCINPAGSRGAVYPLFIFQGYGFPVMENYSVPAILQAGYQFLPLTFFLVILGLLCLSWLYVIIKDRSSVSISNFVLTLFFAALAWWTIRNFAIFAFFALPLTAANFSGMVRAQSSRWLNSSFGTLATVGGAAVLLVLINPAYFFAGGRGVFGIGLKEGNLAALEFIRRERLQGPIFNTFDLGSYLTYGLYPRERVYVDNRPEAYPATFFSEEYFSLLVDEEKWRSHLAANQFNSIVINPGGHSAAAENFVIKRMLDPDWAAVFFDKEILILARRFGTNQPVIAKYELPPEAVLQKAE
jgi:hypothetical protein